MTIQCRQIDDGTPSSLAPLAVEPERCFVQNALYGSLGQQGIHSLLEILAAVPGVEHDAVMSELRSISEE